MKKSFYMLGIFLLGILFFMAGFNQVLAYGDGEEGDGDEQKDGDDDGVDDNVEEDNKRSVEIWFGDNVVEMASIKRSDDKKDIMDLRIAYNEWGISIAVSYRTLTKVNITECEEEHEEENDKEVEFKNCDGEEWIHELKLRFEVKFHALIEYIDLNDNGVFDYENDTCIEDYAINSFHPIVYTPMNLSDDSMLHYFLINTTDGVFATHIYFPEEFTAINGILVAPTQIKIDIEITDYEYHDDNSQLALFTKLFSDDYYKEKEETEDEKEGVAEDEKEVFTDNEEYFGIFSWKETAMIDGVEMPVLTNELEVDCEEDHLWKLLFNYPRGNHIYHDPKIGIVVGQITVSEFPMILVGPIAGVAGLAIIATGILISKKKVR
ncbi:MAG: hypothetical protein ACFFCV_08795 [Promethearchaeota archaeon]